MNLSRCLLSFAGLLSPLMVSVPALVAEDQDQLSPDTRIVWYGTWDSALAEAKRSNRPILLVSAAPHCHNVSGIW